MSAALPHLRCTRRDFREVRADSEALPWREMDAHPLRETTTGAEPQQATSIRIGWTADELRVLFHCSDTHIAATMTRRDAPLYQEEVVEVFIDPVGDFAAYFEIEVNPLNTVLDLVLRRNRSGYAQDTAWNCESLRTAVKKTVTTWTVELAIPFRSLTAEPPKPGAKWRVNFFRIDRAPGTSRELSAWSPTGRPNFHTPERFGIVEFV